MLDKKFKTVNEEIQYIAQMLTATKITDKVRLHTIAQRLQELSEE